MEQSKKRHVELKDHIGIYDGYIPDMECDKAIQLYEYQNKFNKTFNRKVFEKSPIIEKKDKQFFAAANNIDVWWSDSKTLIFNYNLAFNHYIENTGAKAHGPSSFNETHERHGTGRGMAQQTV